MSGVNELITEHCDVAEFQTNTGDWVKVLACKHCGVLLWNVAVHLRETHQTT